MSVVSVELLGVRIQAPIKAGVTRLRGLIVVKQFQFVNKLCSYPHFQGSPVQFVTQMESRSPMGKYLLWLERLPQESFAVASVTELTARITRLAPSIVPAYSLIYSYEP